MKTNGNKVENQNNTTGVKKDTLLSKKGGYNPTPENVNRPKIPPPPPPPLKKKE